MFCEWQDFLFECKQHNETFSISMITDGYAK